MTAAPEPSNVVPITAPVPQVKPRSNSRLAQLHAAYADAKAKADAATADFDAVKTAIKAELAGQLPPGATKIDLASDHGPALRLNYVESWRIDARKLKAEDPETYVRYAKRSGSWRLEALKDGAQ